MSTSYYFGHIRGYKVEKKLLVTLIENEKYKEGMRFDPYSGEKLSQYLEDDKLLSKFEKLLWGGDYYENEKFYIFGDYIYKEYCWDDESSVIETNAPHKTHKNLNTILEFLAENNIMYIKGEFVFARAS
jgi:hypothetical protein